ncbi:hypothetical protein CPB86DRAFT_57804 [Serendipita vermifera]|nr:hypothetical protein CPB86DRAFT_57804 [Serendipita vermifera]
MSRQRIMQARRNHRVGPSSLERLPAEILSEVVKTYLANNGDITAITQICRHLRQVVLGTTSIWNHLAILPEVDGYGPEYRYEYGRIACTTEDQLSFILQRAGSRPLKIELNWPVAAGTLELLASHESPIHSLAIYAGEEPTALRRLNLWTFQNFDLTSLSELTIETYSPHADETLLDLLKDSRRDKLVVNYKVSGKVDHLVRFLPDPRLLQNVTEFPFQSDWDDDYNLFQPESAPCPNIKLWKIVSRIKGLTVFNLSSAETLDYCLKSSKLPFKMAYLPTQLTSMTLRRLNFTPETLVNWNPQLMPNLTTVKFLDTVFHGDLSTYFTLPKIKALYLDQLVFLEKDAEKKSTRSPELPLSDALFCQGLLELEVLSLARIQMDAQLVDSLQPYPLLGELHMDRCKLEISSHPLPNPLRKTRIFDVSRCSTSIIHGQRN